MQGSSDFKVTSGLLAVALTVGGAGLSFPLLQMLLGICALVAAGYFVWTPQARLSPYARVALALAASILALTLLQLVPLPPFVWHRLPGRGLGRSRPATGSPDATSADSHAACCSRCAWSLPEAARASTRRHRWTGSRGGTAGGSGVTFGSSVGLITFASLPPMEPAVVRHRDLRSACLP